MCLVGYTDKCQPGVSKSEPICLYWGQNLSSGTYIYNVHQELQTDSLYIQLNPRNHRHQQEGGRRGGRGRSVKACQQTVLAQQTLQQSCNGLARLLPENCLKAYRRPLRGVILALISTPEWVASQNAPGHQNNAFTSTKLLKCFNAVC